MLAESPYRHELETDVEPFRSILLGLFFLSVGMLLDLQLIAARPLFVIGIAAAVIVTKTILISVLAGFSAARWPRGLRLGLLLSQAGEFGFVLFAPGDRGAADRARSGVAVRRGRHSVDGDDAVPDALHRFPRTARK